MTIRKLREHGSGTATPYETKQGERWRILWHVPKDPHRPELGTRRVSQRGFTSQHEALDALTLIRADQIRGLQTAPDRDSFTAYANRWLEGYDCSSATRTYVRRVIDAVDPYIGTMRLDQIRPSDLAATFRGLEKGLHQKLTSKRPRPGLAKSTVARYSGWVVTILNAAVHDDIIKKNPAQHPNANRPKGPKARRAKPFRVWTANQVSTFCEWALETDQAWAVAWLLLARTGMRSGELLALQWGDFDFEGRTLAIERALHYDEDRPAGERYYIGDVKHGRPRTITISHRVVEVMKAWRKTLLSEHGARVMRVLKATDPVFPTTEGRSATQSALQHSFERVQRAFRQAHPDFNLPNLSVHDLRHTHASLLLHRKQSLKVVQERLGHASGQVTINTYSHLLPGAQQQAADDLDDMLDAPTDEDQTETNLRKIVEARNGR